jgi:hypothetical protein
MNLNNLTKAELISKINKDANKKEMLTSENTNPIKKEKVSSETKLKKDTNNTSKFLEIFRLFKNLILSLTIIATLNKLFKNYKTVRSILKLANYIILSIFGISMLDAFGLGFIVKILGELKYIFMSVITYLSDTTFYNYLMTSLNVAESKESIRTSYNKPVEID